MCFPPFTDEKMGPQRASPKSRANERQSRDLNPSPHPESTVLDPPCIHSSLCWKLFGFPLFMPSGLRGSQETGWSLLCCFLPGRSSEWGGGGVRGGEGEGLEPPPGRKGARGIHWGWPIGGSISSGTRATCSSSPHLRFPRRQRPSCPWLSKCGNRPREAGRSCS